MGEVVGRVLVDRDSEVVVLWERQLAELPRLVSVGGAADDKSGLVVAARVANDLDSVGLHSVKLTIRKICLRFSVCVPRLVEQLERELIRVIFVSLGKLSPAIEELVEVILVLTDVEPAVEIEHNVKVVRYRVVDSVVNGRHKLLGRIFVGIIIIRTPEVYGKANVIETLRLDIFIGVGTSEDVDIVRNLIPTVLMN